MVRGWTGTSEQNNCSCMLRILGRWSLRQDYSCGCKWKQCGRPGQPEGKKGKKVRSGPYWSVRNRRRWILAVRVGDAPVILDLSLPTASDEAQCVFQVEHPCKFQLSAWCIRLEVGYTSHSVQHSKPPLAKGEAGASRLQPGSYQGFLGRGTLPAQKSSSFL